jgi:hypothetical protein
MREADCINLPMRTYPDRESIFQEAMGGIGNLSPTEGADVLLHYFMSVLGGLDLHSVQQLRDELTTRFGGRYCSGQICRMMVELVNGHLEGQRANAPHESARVAA